MRRTRFYAAILIAVMVLNICKDRLPYLEYNLFHNYIVENLCDRKNEENNEDPPLAAVRITKVWMDIPCPPPKCFVFGVSSKISYFFTRFSFPIHFFTNFRAVKIKASP
ncbi:hypothetical protein Barb6XT_02572 [Bacteroidales bacterium Barb6XT]|nr:hypothetical protein Barb6XT_02572 [Bacteroidales bacterium Barb6XT]